MIIFLEIIFLVFSGEHLSVMIQALNGLRLWIVMNYKTRFLYFFLVLFFVRFHHRELFIQNHFGMKHFDESYTSSLNLKSMRNQNKSIYTLIFSSTSSSVLSKVIGFRLLAFICAKYLLQVSLPHFLCDKITFIVAYFQIWRSPMI